jgi:quinol monooxygenase YgiN
MLMQLHIFARFHAKPGNESAVEAALRAVVPPTRAESGCLSLNTFRSTRDPQLFYLHSRWVDEAAFDLHATLPHTVTFIETVRPLIDHEFDLTRATLME